MYMQQVFRCCVNKDTNAGGIESEDFVFPFQALTNGGFPRELLWRRQGRRREQARERLSMRAE